MNKAKRSEATQAPRLSDAKLVIDFATLAKAGLIVDQVSGERLVLRSEADLHCNVEFSDAASALASAGGYENSADRNMLFDAIGVVKIRIRFAQAIRGEWDDVSR
jgi:hypothetical protein